MTYFDKLHLRDKITPIVLCRNSVNYAQYLSNTKRKKLRSFVVSNSLYQLILYLILYFILYFTLFIFLTLCW